MEAYILAEAGIPGPGSNDTLPVSRLTRERSLSRRPVARRRPLDPEERLNLIWRSIQALPAEQRWQLMRLLSRPECAG